MKKPRIIAALLWSDGKIIESKNFIHTNIIHYDCLIALENFNKYYIDEILLINVCKQKNKKKLFLKDLKRLSKNCFIPLAAGGWIENFNDASNLIRSGCDRVIINSLFFKNYSEVEKIANVFGGQSVILSMDVKKIKKEYLIFVDRGTENTHYKIEKYLKRIKNLNIGEILITSIDNEGTNKGYNLDIINKIEKIRNQNFLIFGGASNYRQILKAAKRKINGLVIANLLHYKENEAYNIKKFLKKNKISVRN